MEDNTQNMSHSYHPYHDDLQKLKLTLMAKRKDYHALKRLPYCIVYTTAINSSVGFVVVSGLHRMNAAAERERERESESHMRGYGREAFGFASHSQ